MTIEVLGMVSTAHGSESIGWQGGPVVDVDYLTRFAQAHDRAGFDRILVAHGASSPDGFAVAAHVLYSTERAGVLIAHRPGFVAPTQAARKLATLEHLTGEGRVAIHHITGGSDADQARDGDFVDKDSRYRRTAEFMDVLRRTFTATEPFSFDGEFYRFEGAVSSVRPLREGSIPLYFGGQSDPAIRVGGQHADVFALWGEPLADTAERSALIRASAAQHGRQVEFSLSTRPIIAETEDTAWERAASILDAAQARVDAGGPIRPGIKRHGSRTPPSVRPGCAPRRPRRTSTTSACSSASPGSPAVVATRPVTSARPSRSSTPSWPPTTSASRSSSSAASTRCAMWSSGATS